MLLDVLIILIIAIRPVLSNESKGKEHVEDVTVGACGQYGFRCIDNKRFQICPFRDSEGTTEEPDEYHSCKEGYVCDEDNPAYCSPAETYPIQKCDYCSFDYYDSQGINDDIDNYYPENEVVERERRSECECQPTTTTEQPSTTTETEYFTTYEPSPDPPPFDCDRYGFFADYENKSLFWYCDVPQSGEGFLVRHMACGAGRIFDMHAQACIMPGTIRDTRTNIENIQKNKVSLKSKFSCKGKSPGKYADDSDCQVYHVCLTKNFAPVQELLFSCPEKTAFDPKTKRCSRQATKRCMNKSESMEQVINKVGSKCGGAISCKKPSRFRDLTDCGGYYLCYGDQLLEMRCPEFYKFDDNILECLPEGIAKCDETGR